MALSMLTNLEYLSTDGCPALTALPEDLGDVPRLKTLRLISLPALLALPLSLRNARELRNMYVDTCDGLTPSPRFQLPPNLSEDVRQSLSWLCPPNTA